MSPWLIPSTLKASKPTLKTINRLFRLFRFFKPRKRKQRIFLYPQGNHHHLEDIFNRINAEYFEGKLELKITWFKSRFSTQPRRIILGSYHFRSQLIRINNYLDQPHIPLYFIEYIVYHEALHHVLPPIQGRRGKRSIHHSEFKNKEKEFKDYLLAKEFSKQIKNHLFK